VTKDEEKQIQKWLKGKPKKGEKIRFEPKAIGDGALIEYYKEVEKL